MAIKVPAIQEQQVDISPLPRSFQSTSVPRGAFGEFEAKALQEAGKTISEIGQIVRRKEKERDANFVLDTMTSAEDEMRPFLNDKKSGVRFQLGRNAIGATEKTELQLEKTKSKYEKTLSSPRQKNAFKAMWARYSGSVLNRVGDHEGRQFRVYQDENTASVIKGAIEDVMSDPNDQSVIDAAMIRTESVIAANHHGHGALTIEDKFEDAESQIHSAAVMSLTDTDANAAREYYNKNKKAIKPQIREKIENAISAGALKQTAQGLSDQISDEGGSLEDQLKKVRDITKKKTVNGVDSSDLRDEVERRVKTKYQWEDKMRKERTKAVNDNTWRKIDNGLQAGADINALFNLADEIDDPAVRHRMDDYIRKQMLGTGVTSDMSAYLSINNMISEDPEQLAKFMDLDLNNYRGILSNAHIAKFSDIQKNIRLGNKKGKNQLDGVRTVRQRVNDVLSEFMDPTPRPNTDEARKVNQFWGKLEENIETFEAPFKSKAWYEELDYAINRLVVRGELKGTGIFDDDDVRLFEIIGTPDETGFYVDDKIEDLTAETRSRFENQLRTLKISSEEKKVGRQLTPEEKDGIMNLEISDKLLADYVNRMIVRRGQ